MHYANLTGGPKVAALSYRAKSITLLKEEIGAAITAGPREHDWSLVEGSLVAAFFIGGFDVSHTPQLVAYTWY